MSKLVITKKKKIIINNLKNSKRRKVHFTKHHRSRSNFLMSCLPFTHGSKIRFTYVNATYERVECATITRESEAHYHVH